jgi:hypothetical protein
MRDLGPVEGAHGQTGVVLGHAPGHGFAGLAGGAEHPQIGVEIGALGAPGVVAAFDDHRREPEGQAGIGAGHAGGAGTQDGDDRGRRLGVRYHARQN